MGVLEKILLLKIFPNSCLKLKRSFLNIPTINIKISILTWDCMWAGRLHLNIRENKSMGRTSDDYSPSNRGL
jgi:hypothetical protein